MSGMSGNENRPMTVSEKIFSKAAGSSVKAGDFVLANVDLAMTHDITGPLAVQGFYEIMRDKEEKKVWDPNEDSDRVRSSGSCGFYQRHSKSYNAQKVC